MLPTLDYLHVFDGHNDSLMILSGTERSFFERSDIGHFDIPRAIEGQFGGGLFAIFVPPVGMQPEDGVFSTSMPAKGGEELQAIPGYYPNGSPTGVSIVSCCWSSSRADASG